MLRVSERRAGFGVANVRIWPIATFRGAAEFGRYRGLADSREPSTWQLCGFTAQSALPPQATFEMKEHAPGGLPSVLALRDASSGARSGIHRTEFAAGHLFDLAFAASAVVHQDNLARLHPAFPWLLLDNRLGIAKAA
jgi:hypothetical protein